MKKREHNTYSFFFSFFKGKNWKTIKGRRIIVSSLAQLLLLLILGSTFFLIFSPPSWLTSFGDVSIRRTYLEENVTSTRLEAVSNYVFACFDENIREFYTTPPRQTINQGTAVEKLPNPTIYGSLFGAQALLLLNQSSINSTDHFTSRFRSVFDKYIARLTTILQKGTESYAYYGPAYLWGFYLILQAFHATQLVPRENWIEMIVDDFDEETGAFSPHVNGIPGTLYTRNAFFLLRELNALDRINWTKATEYVLSLQLKNGYFTSPLFYGIPFPGPTIWAYSFLNASNQLSMINVTRLQEIVQEIYSQNLIYNRDSAVMEFLTDFVVDIGYDFLTYFPNVEETLQEIVAAQNTFYGGFPYSWKVDPTDEQATIGVDISETYSILWLLATCNRLELLAQENITIRYPPLSLYTETRRLVGLSLGLLLFFSVSSSFLLVLVILKKSKKKISFQSLEIK
ncbi:MAG: hypothetical protein ACTSRO_05795 [Candidatus Heimdallarchaeaceae archaeon]